MALRSSLFGFENEVYKWIPSLNIDESVFHLQPRLGQIALGQSPNSSLGQRKEVGQAQPVPDSNLNLARYTLKPVEHTRLQCETYSTSMDTLISIQFSKMGGLLGLQPYCYIAVTTSQQQWQRLIKQTQTYKYLLCTPTLVNYNLSAQSKFSM